MISPAMSISPAGAEFIRDWEKYVAKPYLDDAGNWTWGYGHKQQHGEQMPAFIGVLSARDLWQRDMLPFVKAVNNAVCVSVNQNQFDALVSLTENVGPGLPGYRDGIILLRNGKQSTLLTELNEGNFAGAARQFLVWNKAAGKISNGLVNRRIAEKQLFEQPVRS